MGAKRILIVDDDSTVSSVTAAMVRALGHSPVVAWGLESARSIWIETKGAFDLALIDYNLQDGLGTTLAAQIRKEKPAVPVFITTGMTEADVDLPEGVGFIGKPFSLDTLNALLKRLE